MYTNFFASTYDSGAYGASTYETGVASSGSSTGSSSGGGVLTNTGFDILLAATIACTLIFAALVVRFWKRPTKLSDQAAD